MTFEIRNDQFYLGEQPFHIYSGAIHYFRVPREYWRDRLQKLKAQGLNTVETYVCWNLHEPTKGEFHFDGDLDIVEFLKIAQELGLYAIVRPGPYICAEWDFGGFPAWLLAEEKIRLRHFNEVYLKHVKEWYQKLFSLLGDLQITRGGNILAMQVENEYGSFSRDKKYLSAIKDIMLDCGCEVLLFTADGTMQMMINNGGVDGVYQALNFGSQTKKAFASIRKKQPNAPKTCMEFWDGWFDHWTEKHHTRTSNSVMTDINEFFELDANFNLYMFHGGTNFGFTAGANFKKIYQPTITSYDYCAPLSEWGGYTPLYHDLRKALLSVRNIDEDSLPLPDDTKFQDIGQVSLRECASLVDALTTIGKEHHCDSPVKMEKLAQNTGYMWYSTTLSCDYASKTLSLQGVGDMAYVYVNGKLQKRIWRNDKASRALGFGNDGRIYNIKLQEKLCAGTRIDILVEGMGRVNYGRQIYDRKGLKDVMIGGKHLKNWTIHTLPMDNLDNLQYSNANSSAPCFLKGYFDACDSGDCFVHLNGFGKGFVVVNGHNLGRYWNVGPQQALYLPGCWLHKDGKNEIIVFEQEGFENATVTIDSNPDLG